MSKDSEYFKKQTVAKKFYPKEILISDTIYFQEKHFQCTFYVPQGSSPECRYTPQVGVSMKLGNDNLKLFLTSVPDFEQVLRELTKFYEKNKPQLEEALAKSKNDYWNRQKKDLALSKDNAIIVDKETGEIIS
jgi:thymidylate synthase